MDTALFILGVALLFVVCAVGLVALLFGLPGTFIIALAALVYGWATGFASVGSSVLLWLAALAVLGEILEFASSAALGGGESPSRRVQIAALAGAFVGGLLGTPLLFGLGALMGALLGAFAGASLAVASEGGSAERALSTGLAALRGRFLGFVLKSIIAVTMIVLLATTIF